jgi:O-antigen/teichoic acid export membrane protein
LPVFDPLVLLITVNLGTTASKLLLLLTLSHLKGFGGYRIRPTLFRHELVRRMLRFGSKSLVQGIAGQVSKRADAVLIGIFLGPQRIVFYNLAHMLLQRLSSLTQLAGHAFMPAFSTFHGAGEQQRMEDYFFTGTRYVYALHAAACVAVAIVGADFLKLWVGPDYSEQARPLIWVLVAGGLIAGSLPLHNRLLTALDRHGQLAVLYSIRAVLNVILTIVLLPLMDLLGVAVATLLANTFMTPLIWRAVFRELQGTIIGYIRHTLVPVFGAVGFMAVVMLAARMIDGVESWLHLLAVIAAGGASFMLIFLWAAMGTRDRAFMREAVQRLRPWQ